MKRITKIIALSLCLMCVHFAYASSDSSVVQSSPPNDCPKPCPPAPCPKPCPPAPCPKPCPPAPCPKPCPPKPCKPCPPVCFERGYPDTQCCIPSAYNEPADYELSPCPWDFWFDASFTYWLAYEEGLELAESFSDLTAVPLAVPEKISILSQDTSWKPGFKVGLGMDFGHDHWSGYAEYTWFRSRTTTSKAAPVGPAGSIDPIWVLNSWELDQTQNFSALSSVWRLRMDLLDAALTRPYYQGTHLIVSPFGGLRAAWIRQNLRIATTPDASIVNGNPHAVFHNKSYSWAIGPRAGFQGEWHLGWGFRFEGDVAGSILFTRYTTVATSTDGAIIGARLHDASYHDYDTIRFNNDMNVGIGWGDYFDCRNYHFDLLLTYDFQIFWNQNMMKHLVDYIDVGVSTSPSNLYLQGLTVRAQFDF